MPYQILNSDKSVLLNLADNTVDNTTSLTLVGRNFPGYGAAIANNFIYLLENGATSGVQPAAPLTGQLWYDKSHSLMNVWTGSTWFALTTGVSSILGLTGAITLNQLSTAGLAPINSPTFTGVPTGPTAAVGTDNNQLATCAYVRNQVGSVVGGVSSVLGNTGAISLAQLIGGGVAPLGSPHLTGLPTAPTPAIGTNNTQVATTAYVISQVGSLSTGVTSVCGHSGAVTLDHLRSAGVATTTSPNFSGNCTAPTPAFGTNSNQVATCAFVLASVSAQSNSTAGGDQGGSGSGTSTARKVSVGDLTLYVSAASGNDVTGNGTQGLPFATLQTAYDTAVQTYDGGGNNLVIQMLPGNAPYTGGLTVSGNGLVGFPNGVVLSGAGGAVAGASASFVLTPTSGNAVTVSAGAQLTIQGITITGLTGSNTTTLQSGNGLFINQGGICTIGAGMVFGTVGGYHILVQNATCTCTASYTITGGATNYHIGVASNGLFSMNGFASSATVTLTGTPTFTGFVNAAYNSSINIAGVTYAGAAIGSRFAISGSSNVLTNGSGLNFFPGSTPGTGNTTTANNGGGFYG